MLYCFDCCKDENKEKRGREWPNFYLKNYDIIKGLSTTSQPLVSITYCKVTTYNRHWIKKKFNLVPRYKGLL